MNTIREDNNQEIEPGVLILGATCATSLIGLTFWAIS